MIVTFLAVLELIRLKRVKVYQKGNFGTIRIFRPIGPEAGAPVPTVLGLWIQKNDKPTERSRCGGSRRPQPVRECRPRTPSRKSPSFPRRRVRAGAGGAHLLLAATHHRARDHAGDAGRAEVGVAGGGGGDPGGPTRATAAALQLVEVAAGYQITTRPRVQRLGPPASRSEGRRRVFPSRPWRRWPSSPTSSRRRCRRSSTCAG